MKLSLALNPHRARKNNLDVPAGWRPASQNAARGCASLYIVSGNFAVQRDLGDVQDSVSNSRRYRVEAKIAHTVRHDTLTDLPNGVLSSANAWKMP
jgi:hypothetical protein